MIRRDGLFGAILAIAGAGAVALAAPAWAQPAPKQVTLDRVVARWHAPETGGIAHPQFIFERELAFEARIEALADPDVDSSRFRERHVGAALDRHIAETVLASLPVLPALRPREIAMRAEAARGVLEQRVRGRARLIAAASAEGIGSDELDALLRRQARASLYLDRMVAPMLEPSDLELREIWAELMRRPNDLPVSFADARPVLRRLYVGRRLNQAIDAYYQNARSRVTVILIRR